MVSGVNYPRRSPNEIMDEAARLREEYLGRVARGGKVKDFLYKADTFLLERCPGVDYARFKGGLKHSEDEDTKLLPVLRALYEMSERGEEYLAWLNTLRLCEGGSYNELYNLVAGSDNVDDRVNELLKRISRGRAANVDALIDASLLTDSESLRGQILIGREYHERGRGITLDAFTAHADKRDMRALIDRGVEVIPVFFDVGIKSRDKYLRPINRENPGVNRFLMFDNQNPLLFKFVNFGNAKRLRLAQYRTI